MNRRFLTALAWAAALMFVGSTVAEAVDIKLGGQLRPRWEFQDRDFNDDTDGSSFLTSRVRLQATASIDDKTSAFIQLQSVRVDGQADTRRQSGGPTNGPASIRNAAETVNDLDNSVGVHQAYFTIKDLYGLPLNLKFGRQEVIFDGHRIVGNTLWTAGAQSHDGVSLYRTTSRGLSFWYTYSKARENGDTGNGDTGQDNTDLDAHLLRMDLKDIAGGHLSLYFVALNNKINNIDEVPGPTKANPTSVRSQSIDVPNSIFTTGFRQAGKLFGIDYRGEFYYQFGDADVFDATTGTVQAWDRDAVMFGIRAGKNFGGSVQPTVTLYYDYLSGTDEKDFKNGKVASFDTLFDTGHKFYGFMDRFLNIGLTGRSGGSSVTSDVVGGLGLQDMAIKGSIKPIENWMVKVDYHAFFTQQTAYIGTGSLANISQSNVGNNDLGQELDLTFVHKYSPSTKFTFGYSHFFSGDLTDDLLSSRAPGTGKGDDSDWAYVMLDVKF